MNPTANKLGDNASRRPLVFITVVWGEAFRDYLTGRLFRSLLAPRNLPADIGREKILLICGPEEDWRILDALPITRMLRAHCRIEWIPFEPARHRQIRSMSIGLAMCLRRASELDGYVSQFPPDAIYCADAVQTIGKYMDAGHRLVLTPAFRCDQDAIYRNIPLPDGDPAPIEISARDLNALSIRCLHSQMLVTDIDAPYFFRRSHNFHVRGPNDEWFVGRNMAWGLTLMDMRGISSELIDEAARSVIDSYILAKMFPPSTKIRYVTRWDEYAMISWATSDWSAIPMTARWPRRIPALENFIRYLHARSSLKYFLLWNRTEDDWIKRQALVEADVMFGDLDIHGRAMENGLHRIDKLLSGAAADLLDKGSPTIFARFMDITLWTLRKIEFASNLVWDRDYSRDRLRARIREALQRFSLGT
jgi:hypothetical protein